MALTDRICAVHCVLQVFSISKVDISASVAPAAPAAPEDPELEHEEENDKSPQEPYVAVFGRCSFL